MKRKSFNFFTIFIVIALFVLAMIATVLVNNLLTTSMNINAAQKEYNRGNYEKAYTILEDIDGVFLDPSGKRTKLFNEVSYELGIKLYEQEEYLKSICILARIGNYRESEAYILDAMKIYVSKLTEISNIDLSTT